MVIEVDKHYIETLENKIGELTKENTELKQQTTSFKPDTNMKPIKGEAIFTLYMSSYINEHDWWFKNKKQDLLASVADLVEYRPFYGKFDITSLNEKEIHEEIDICRRADGQYILNGETVSLTDLEKAIEENCKKLVFHGFVIEE